MGTLSAEQLSGQVAFEERDVDLPELGGSVKVRALSVGRRARMRKGIINAAGDITDPGEFEIRMFVAGMHDPKVTREQALILKENWPAAMWDRVILAIAELGSADPEEVAQSAADEFQGADD